METFLDLLRESTIIQAGVTIILVGGVVYMWCTGQTPPDAMLQLTGLVVGYWFGSKTQQAIARSTTSSKPKELPGRTWKE